MVPTPSVLGDFAGATVRVTAALALVLPLAASVAQSGPGRSLQLTACAGPRMATGMQCGVYDVFENRTTRQGRKIPIHVTVLPATHAPPPGRLRAEPLFIFAGGPGQAASAFVPEYASSWIRDEHDIVMVDVRGTGESNPLDCKLPGSDADPQSYLAEVFTVATFERCRLALEPRADLTQYTTPNAMSDVDDVRAALGYERIDMWGGSGGTRSELVYMRMFPSRVRAAILTGVVPLSFTNPLFHAASAQRGLDLILAACASEAPCAQAFPNLRAEVDSVFARVTRDSATAQIRSPATGSPVTIRLGHDGFAEALRVMTYSASTVTRVPLALHRAYKGDYSLFAQIGIANNRGLHSALQFGFLLSVTCAEDVARIDTTRIPAVTRGTYLGDTRVRHQIEVCAHWPHATMPRSYGEPVSVPVPVLLLSGSMDPVTPPQWADSAVRHLPNGLHVVLPGSHGVDGPCVDRLQRQFLAAASVRGIDTACAAEAKLAPFVVR